MNIITVQIPEKLTPPLQQSRKELFEGNKRFAFTTTLCLAGKQEVRAWNLHQHLARLKSTCKELKLSPVTEEDLAQLFHQVVKRLPQSNQYYSCRIVSFGVEKTLTLSKCTFPNKLTYSLFPTVSDRETPHLKSHHCKPCFDLELSAKRNGHDEALILSPNKEPLEGGWSNFFWITESNEIKTVADGVLPGITRELLKPHVNFVDPTIEPIKGAFLSKSTTGINLVTQIGGDTIPIHPEALKLKDWMDKKIDEELIRTY